MKNEVEVNGMFLDADALIAEKKISEALNLLDAIIMEDPAFGKAHNHIGWIYHFKLNDNKKAELHYKTAISCEPEYYATYMNYAYLLSGQKRFQELKVHLDKAVNISGINKASVYNEYAIMYEFQCNYKEAIVAFKQAITDSLDAKSIENYNEGIKRCKNKAGFLKSLFW